MSFLEIYGWIKKHPLLTLAIVLCVSDAAILSIYLRHQPRVLTVAFLDVGQGDAVYIEAPNGNQMLYDAGPPSGAVLRALADVMPFYDRSIDVAVFSHPDMDHIGGFVDVFDRYKVDVMLEPGASSTNGIYDEAEHAIQTHHLTRLIARRGMSIDLGAGVVADILYPDHDMTNVESNSASIVMRIHYGSTSFLLSGDLPIKQENYLAELSKEGLHAQVLKLGHHGSHTSSGELWLTTVHPDIAVASAGLNNRYGHPHKDTLTLLDRLNIPYLVTFNEGTIRFESNGKEVVRK